ncbi:unnamed protein product [Coffea canephora]|uniref:Uncharacterized protein n=1 Tax=Coffea canephora TaxID=49390 RepID=A0A068TWZ6_COFCA|nr:unnamed protein product [Coffea canephora]
MAHVSDIKLIRTDTTLDLSQKAEKGMLFPFLSSPNYSLSITASSSSAIDVGERLPHPPGNSPIQLFYDFTVLRQNYFDFWIWLNDFIISCKILY